MQVFQAVWFSFLFWAISFSAGAQASIKLAVWTNATEFIPGDTLHFNATIEDSVYEKRALTLNVFIEDVHRSCRWRLRYPMLQGKASAFIILPQGTPDDYFAVHFSLQPYFFDLLGMFKMPQTTDSVAYAFIQSGQQLFSGKVPLQYETQFRLGKLLFEEEGSFVFFDSNEKQLLSKDIGLVTILDSAYHTAADTTFMIKVGAATGGVVFEEYRFDPTNFITIPTGKEVIAFDAKSSKRLDKLEAEYVQSKWFASKNSYAFEPSFSGSDAFINLFFGLRAMVPELEMKTDEQGWPGLYWSGSPTTVFLNEHPVSFGQLQSVSAKDVVFAKLFKPPFFGATGGGPGGALAIYTRKGSPSYRLFEGRFSVAGYTPSVYELPARF